MNPAKVKGAVLVGCLIATATSQATPIVGSLNISGEAEVGLIYYPVYPGPETPTSSLATAEGVRFPTLTTIDVPGFGTLGPVTPYNGKITAVSGVFAGSVAPAVGTSLNNRVRYFDFDWSPPSTPVVPLWVTTSGPSWTFELSSLAVQSQNASFVNLTGLGYFDDGIADNAPGNKFDRTLGDWTFTLTTTSSLFTWTASDAAPPRNRVPDNGGGLALLGGALLTTGFLRRKIKG